jgi:transposase
MVSKHYPKEFKADAVALYRSRPAATIASIADDLGINRETLRSWVRADDQRRGGRGGPVVSAGRAAPAAQPCPGRRITCRIAVKPRLLVLRPCWTPGSALEMSGLSA